MEINTEQYEQVYLRAKKIITDYLRLKDDELQPDSHIVDDIGADSLALVELGFQISETFGVPIADTSGNKLVFKHLVEYILENMKQEKPL
jgi:acyl carrier protein